MTDNRVPTGVPTGGQFAASARDEADVPLRVSPSGLGTGEFIDVADLNEGDQFVYTWGLGNQNGDQVVTTCSVFRDGLHLTVITDEIDRAIDVDPDATVELAGDAAFLTGGLGEGRALDQSESDRLRTAARAHQADPWADATADLPTFVPTPDPWARLKPTDDEYTTETTRQTSGPIKVSDTDVSPRRAKAFADMIRDGEIDLNPPYQRASVWTMDQRVNLIKSFLAQTPVPAVIINRRHTPKWAANNDGPLKAGQPPYVVIDGKQRLETVRAWFNNELAVPKSWFADEDVVDHFETSDGPYVNYLGLSVPARRDFAQNAILPVGEAAVATIAEEAEMYVRVNAAGTTQSDADMANAQSWADGSAEDHLRHQCGNDYDPYCDGCRAAASDAGFSDKGL